MEPLVSVIIPTLNGETHLHETLDSVLRQSYRWLEIIVVDNGSGDNTRNIALSYAPHVKLIAELRRGHPAARNSGIRAATGPFLSFLDHDDLWHPAKIEMQVEYFQNDPELDLVFGHIQNFFSPELSEAEKQSLSVPLDPLPGLLQGAMLAKRSAFDRVGLFSEEREMGDFLDWYGRAMILELKTQMPPEVVLRRRIHRTNYNRTHGHLRRQYLPALKQLLDRRRAAVKCGGEV